MADEQARMVFTNPPYDVPIDGHFGGSGKTRNREFAMASGEMTKAERPISTGRRILHDGLPADHQNWMKVTL